MNKLFINCDGGSRGNPGPSACAFIVKDLDGNLVYREGNFLGLATNNQAEYAAVFTALTWVSKTCSESEVVFMLDSQLVVNQLKRTFKIKDATLQTKAQEIFDLIASTNLKVRNYVYVPRSVNYEADALVNETLDNNIF